MTEPLALPLGSWPPEYQRALGRLASSRRGRRSYASSTLAATQAGMGQYLATVQRAGLPLQLSREGLGIFVGDLDARNLSSASRLRYMANVQAIAKEIGYPPTDRALLLEDCAIYREDMRGEIPRKVIALQKRPLTLRDIRKASLSARETSRAASSPNRRRSLLQRAVLLRLLSYLPLRIGDVSQLTIGTTLLREADGWRLCLSSGKTGYRYDTDLHPDLTEWLDELVRLDEDGVRASTARGQPLFRNEIGESISVQTLRMAFKAATGHTPHIVRTLVHDELARLSQQGTALALDLCGQVSDGIERHYQIHAERHRQELAQAALAKLQTGLLAPALESDDG